VGILVHSHGNLPVMLTGQYPANRTKVHFGSKSGTIDSWQTSSLIIEVDVNSDGDISFLEKSFFAKMILIMITIIYISSSTELSKKDGMEK